MSLQDAHDELVQKYADLEDRFRELKKFAAVFQSAVDGMAITDLDGRFIAVNEKLCTTMGYSREELLQMYAVDLKPSPLKAEFQQNFELLKEQGTISLETVYLRKNGTPIPGSLTASVVELEGEPVVQVSTRDITERRRREETLHRYEQVFSLTDDLVAFVDKDYIYQMVNESYSRDFNKKRDEIVGHSVAELIGDELFHGTVKPQIDRCLSGEVVRYQIWMDYPAMGRRYREIAYYPYRPSDDDDRGDGVFVVVHDLTDLKLAQEDQQAKHALLSQIIENSQSGIYVVNEGHEILFTNSVMKEFFGAVDGRKCFEYIAGRKSPCPSCQNKTVFSGTSVQRELTVQQSAKVYAVTEALLKNTEFSRAKVVFFMDITEKKEAESNLRDYNEQLTTLINTSPDIICFKDGKGRWLLANEADLQLFQLANVDYQGKTDADLAAYTEFYREPFLACMESDEEAWEKGELSRGEEIIPVPDGEAKVFDVVKVPLFEADGSRKGLVVLGHDITDLRRKEEQLRREISARQQASEVMEEKGQELEEANIALRVLLKQQKNDAEEVQQRVLAQHEKAVFPYLDLLQQTLADDKSKEYLGIIRHHLKAVGSSFIQRMSNPNLGLTKREILIADLVRSGSSTKEIADLLGLQPPSVESYRNKIRKKFNINNKKIRLREYLEEMFISEY